MYDPRTASIYIIIIVHNTFCLTTFKGGSRDVSKVSRNWSDHLWLVFACISLLMSMRPYSYTFMCWKPVIKVSLSALDVKIATSNVTSARRAHSLLRNKGLCLRMNIIMRGLLYKFGAASHSGLCLWRHRSMVAAKDEK